MIDDGVAVEPRPEPRKRLDPRARMLWRAHDLLMAIPLLGIASGATWLLTRLDLPSPVPLAPLPVVLTIVLVLALAVIAPEVRWRHWRYEIGDREVDLQRGLVTITRTLIPFARIQHVETRRGLIERRLGLASVVLYTAAGSSEIPALADQVASAARDRIAALSRTDEDV